MTNLGQLMKQAREAQTKLEEIRERLAAIEIVGTSGAGMVSMTMNGRGALRAVKIDPALLNGDEAEVVEDLIVAAFNDAKSKVEARAAEEFSKATAGLPLPPGLDLSL